MGLIEAAITVIVVLAVLAIVVWAAKAVLAEMRAPHLAFVIVTAIACLLALLVLVKALSLAPNLV